MGGYKTLKDSKRYLDRHPLPADLVEALKGLEYLIYGGWVRDLIAQADSPNFKSGFADIDIILLWRSHATLISRLQAIGYDYTKDEHSIRIYRHWGAVSHVYSLIKRSDSNAPRIQLAAPQRIVGHVTQDKLRNALLEPVEAVDLRCCGVAIAPNMNILEVVSGAVDDCRKMQLIESPLAAHKINIYERIKKFEARGWSPPWGYKMDKRSSRN